MADCEYVDGLRAALSAAVDYAFEAVEQSERQQPPPIPSILLNQARLAARNRVGLSTVFRRYYAGYSLLTDILLDETKGARTDPDDGRRLLRKVAWLFDQLLGALSKEYEYESNRYLMTDERQKSWIEGLLAGELLDRSVVAGELAYTFNDFHLAVIVSGLNSAELIRDCARRLDCRPLIVKSDDLTLWCWLGARQPTSAARFAELASDSAEGLLIAIGETGRGFAGWRLSHQQADAALRVARRSRQSVVRYADVAVEASLLGDHLLATSLQELYLAPLEVERDGGADLRAALRAYFTAHHNRASAARALGISRPTFNSRIHRVEELLEQPLSACALEVETALRADALPPP